ncbi:MAG: hypothetical protein ACM3X9_06780 [Bacillota bacterium]
MKIIDSAISLTSHHTYSRLSIHSTTAKFQLPYGKTNDTKNDVARESPGEENPVNFQIIPFLGLRVNLWYQVEASGLITDLELQKQQILERFLRIITGKNLRFYNPASGFPFSVSLDQTRAGRVGSSLRAAIKENNFYQENEVLSFQAGGIFKTVDGKVVNFEISLNLEREFAAVNGVNLQTGRPIDPLIINYDGPAASLTATKFSFDIDSNGQAEQLSFVNQGSGLLTLDLNNDGTVNNGTELFGAKSGNGFKELAAYDSDLNGWIDENDPIYNKLRIWTKDDSGKDQLFALGQKGVGAIYLGSVEAPFSYKNQFNITQGENRRAGLFAREDGQVGTIQQADLIV